MAKKTIEKPKRRTRHDNKIKGASEIYPWLPLKDVKVLQNGGYYDCEGLLHKADGCIRCTSVVKVSGKRCRNFAVPGELSCYIHGGVRGRTKAGKRRMYSAFIEDPTLKTLYENADKDENTKGIKEELSLLRTLLGRMVNRSTDFGPGELKDVANVIKEIRALVADSTNTQIKLGQLIDISKIAIIVKRLADVVASHVTDQKILEQIAYGFDNVILPATFGSSQESNQHAPVREVPRISGEVCT